MNDATDKRVFVRVTRKHIRNGIKGDYERCPFALALNDAMAQEGIPGPFTVMSGDYGRKGVQESLPLPPLVSAWIDAFDHEVNVKPFLAEVATPDEIAPVSGYVRLARELGIVVKASQ